MGRSHHIRALQIRSCVLRRAQDEVFSSWHEHMQFSIFLILSLSKDAQAEGQANTFAKEGLRLAAGAKNTIFAKKQVGRRPTFLFDGGQGSAVDTGKIEAMVTPSLEAMGYRLVRVSMTGGRRATLQVMAERLDGAAMTVEDCADISCSTSPIPSSVPTRSR
jgi:RimP N-terminal domain